MFKAFSTGRVAAATLLGLLAGLSLPAAAQVHKCTQADGSISFQAGACTGTEPPPPRVTAAQLNAARRARERALERAAADPGASKVKARSPGPAKPSVASPFAEDAKVVTAEDRRRACTIARNDLAVPSHPTPASGVDHEGKRQDVAPGDGAGRLAIARRDEARYCK